MIRRMLLIAALLEAQVSYVASVKRNNSAEARTFTEYFPGGRFIATAVTLRRLLHIAYRGQDFQIVGAPAWFNTLRYDIAAKTDNNPVPTQQTLLRALLADRFGLEVHNERREMPTFALAVAKSGKLIPSDFDCVAYGSAAHALPDPARTPVCGTRINAGALSGKSITMAQLASTLIPFVNRFTIDKTGLAGRFDVDLHWTPDEAISADSVWPSLFTALEEQLGLKLVAEKGPVEILVVDRAWQPAAN